MRMMNRRFQNGFTLLEVLITVIVMSVGLLGLAALHNLALTNAQGSHHHSLATTYIYDALDRLRAGEELADVQTSFAADRYTRNFPGDFNMQIDLAIDGHITITASWDDARLGDGGESSTNQLVVRSRL